MDVPFEPELLIQHGRFLRLLAFHLVRDPHAADDLAQEACLRALQQPTLEAGRLSPWLRRVVTNLARNRRRAEANLRAREERAARPEALPSVAEEFERAELLRGVIEAVLALEEPYRTTILCRYFRGWDAPRLAAETDTPLATVRSREQRALELLRAALDRNEGGRAAWALALGRLVDLPGPGAAASSRGPVSAARLALLAAAGVVAVLGTRALVASAASPGSIAIPAAEPASPGSRAAEPSASQAGPSSRVQESAVVQGSARVALAPVASSSTGSSALLADDACTIRGRFLLPDGAPASGMEVKLHGYCTDDERLWEFGDPADWQDPSALTDAEGGFELAFVPPRSFQFEFEAARTGFARERRFWVELRAGETKDLGEVELLPGGALEGRLLDAQGRPLLLDGLEARVDGQRSGLRAYAGGRELTWGLAPIDPLTGAFRFEDLAPGRVRLGVTQKRNAFLDGPQAVIVPGQTATVDLVYDGPDLARRITVSLAAPYASRAALDPNAIRLSGPGLEPRAPRAAPPNGQLAFDDLAPGEYTLSFDDPRFQPWRREGVTPGTAVNARLVGNSALVLDVRDAEGHALERYSVVLSSCPTPTTEGGTRTSFRPQRERLHDGSTPLPGGRLDGLVAGDYTVRVEVEGLERREVGLAALQPNETRALSVVFGPQPTLAGRVSWPDGAPVAGVEVVLLEPAQEGDSPRSLVCLPDTTMGADERARHELARTTSGAAGAFEFALPRAGSYAVYAFRGALDAGSASVAVGADEHHADLALVLPRGARIAGRIALPSGAPRALRVWARRDDSELPRAWIAREADQAVLAADGSFELGPLASGTAEFVLLLPVENLSGWSRTADGRISGGDILGTLALVEGAEVRADFDLTARAPGALAVTVLLDGAPAPGLRVILVTPGDDDENASAGTDPAGVARLPAFPGTYAVRVEDEDGGWSYVAPALVDVQPGAMSAAQVAFELVAGTVECVDAATGQPLADQDVWLTSRSSGVWPQAHGPHTDAAGRLALRLPPGEYHVGRPGQRLRAVLSWTTAGPLVPRLEL